MPCANLAIFEYVWGSFWYVMNPPPTIAEDHGIPPHIQAFFTILLVLWALFPIPLLVWTFRGKNWAKWIFITYSVANRKDFIWSTYAVLTFHPGSADFRDAFLVGQSPFFLLQAILLTASIVCLSLPPSNRWFKADPA